MSDIKAGPYMPCLFGDDVLAEYEKSYDWLTVAVQHSIFWPVKDILLKYDGKDYFLRYFQDKRNETYAANISVRLTNENELESTLSLLYKFTSILSWFMEGHVSITNFTRGSRPTVLYPHIQSGSRIAKVSHNFSCNYMPILDKDDKIHRALSFWREGLQLEHIHKSYSYLSFYKVIESQFQSNRNGKQQAREWIKGEIQNLPRKAQSRIQNLSSKGIDVSKHIFKSGRCAVAHASLDGKTIDPDNPEDLIRIREDLVVMRELAKKFIHDELKMPTKYDVLWRYDVLNPLNSSIRKNQMENIKK